MVAAYGLGLLFLGAVAVEAHRLGLLALVACVFAAYLGKG